MSRLVLSLAILGLLLAGSTSAAAKKPPPPAKLKKLIEMGWDEPDPGFMRRHLAEMEAMPFDGCVYHLFYTTPGRPPASFTSEAWGRRAFTTAELDSGTRDLVATPFRRFRWNFLRVNVTPADLDWFDDHGAVFSNLRLAASIARRGHSAGVMIDTEPYQNNLFRYPMQRDTALHSFAEYAAQVRRRGAEAMRALEQGYPGLTVFLTVGASYAPLQRWWWHKEEGPYGLLFAFVDGMVSAASDSACIVDGCESSYPVRDPAKLDVYYQAQTHGAMTWVSDSLHFKRVASRSFGLWMDHEWGKLGWNVAEPDSNYRPPAQLTQVVRRALELADDYVWIYTEKARWWTEAGTPQFMPDAYIQALREARKGIAP